MTQLIMSSELSHRRGSLIGVSRYLRGNDNSQSVVIRVFVFMGSPLHVESPRCQ